MKILIRRVMNFRQMISALFTLAVLNMMVMMAEAATIEISSGDNFEAAVENLKPGDILIVHGGIYSGSGRISITVEGTATSPVVIQAAPGEKPIITRPDANQNVINIEGNAAYLTIRGLEITGGGDGINLSGNNHHITIEDNHIHDVGEVGINFRNNAHSLIVRRNHIHHTHDTAEGMYIGCNYSACVVRDSIFENNWIHDTGKGPGDSQGDGIELKQGSYNNIIRDNVIYNTNWPCIIVYGTDGNPQNIIERNIMWDCGEAGIQVQGEAIVLNNIIFNTKAGIGDGLISQNHQATVTNLQIVHNTIIGNASIDCMALRNWDGKSNMVLANNAVYCDGGVAITFPTGSTGVTISNNVIKGSVSGISGGTVAGRSTGQDFVNASGRDAWPSADSPLRGAANAVHTVPNDFNRTSRTSPYDVGAYEADSSLNNTGWKVQEGFKVIGMDTVPPAPPKNLKAN